MGTHPSAHSPPSERQLMKRQVLVLSSESIFLSSGPRAVAPNLRDDTLLNGSSIYPAIDLFLATIWITDVDISSFGTTPANGAGASSSPEPLCCRRACLSTTTTTAHNDYLLVYHPTGNYHDLGYLRASQTCYCLLSSSSYTRCSLMLLV